jgi:hypothetical protein
MNSPRRLQAGGPSGPPRTTRGLWVVAARRSLLAAVVLAAFATAASAADEKKEKKPDVKKRKVSIFVDGTGCAYDVEAKPLTLQMAKREVLGLRIKNDCGFEQKALLCAYSADGHRESPFECTSVPASLAVGSAFKLASRGGAADFDCTPHHAGKYAMHVVVAAQTPAGGCPASPPKERLGALGDTVRNHRLDVEIVPEPPPAAR